VKVIRNSEDCFPTSFDDTFMVMIPLVPLQCASKAGRLPFEAMMDNLILTVGQAIAFDIKNMTKFK
jgi:hypothetical protein